MMRSACRSLPSVSFFGSLNEMRSQLARYPAYHLHAHRLRFLTETSPQRRAAPWKLAVDGHRYPVIGVSDCCGAFRDGQVKWPCPSKVMMLSMPAISVYG
jgi:hypothetical protein